MRLNILIIILNLAIFYGQEWNYSADILEKKTENGREVRIFKSTTLGDEQVVIYKDTISILTNQAKHDKTNESTNRTNQANHIRTNKSNMPLTRKYKQ